MNQNDPTCCELACYEDPGCACDGCQPVPRMTQPAPTREADYVPPDDRFDGRYRAGHRAGWEARALSIPPSPMKKLLCIVFGHRVQWGPCPRCGRRALG